MVHSFSRNLVYTKICDKLLTMNFRASGQKIADSFDAVGREQRNTGTHGLELTVDVQQKQ